MALFKADKVTAARHELDLAEAAVGTEEHRLEVAIGKAKAFEAEAANVDPDDGKAFEKATARLAELRAAVDLIRARETSAKTRAEAARRALDAAEIEDKRMRFEKLNADVAQRDGRARESVRRMLGEVTGEIDAIRAALSEVDSLQPVLERRQVRACRSSARIAEAGTSPAHLLRWLATLVDLGELR